MGRRGGMGVQCLSGIGLGFGTLIGKAQLLPIPALDKINLQNVNESETRE